MRTFTNKPGTVFDANKTTVLYAEDLNEFKTNITNNTTDIATKAADNAVVKINGDQTINNVKSWSAMSIFSAGFNAFFGLFSSGNEANVNTRKQLKFDINFGGYSHYVTTEHNSASTLNKIKFWLNTSSTQNGSSAPGTGNELILELSNNGIVAKNYNVVSGIKNAGDYIELDGVRVAMSGSGNRSFGIYTTSGTIEIDGVTRAVDHSSSNLCKLFNVYSVGTTFTYFESSWNFLAHGIVQETTFFNNSNGYFYKFIGIVGSGYGNNKLRLERLN